MKTNDLFRLSRRGFLKTSSTAAIGVASSTLFFRTAFAQTNSGIAVALDWVADVGGAGLFVAMERGYFKDSGLDVTYFPGGPNAPEPLVSLSAGRAQLAQALWLPYLDARAQGNDFVVIGAGYPVNPGGILSLPAKPIRTVEDMQGKTFLIQYPSLEVELKGISRVNNIEPDFKTAPTGFSADALFGGDGDGYLAFITNEPIALAAEGKIAGKDYVVTRLADLGYPVPTTMFTVQRDLITNHREDLVHFLAALMKGWKDTIKDPQFAVDLTVDKYGRDLGLEKDNQLKVLKATLDLIKSPDSDIYFELPVSQQERMVEFAKKSGQDKVPAKEDLFDMSLLHDAAKLV
ncbi:ABC transporter substrate-binding protein [Rhizobium sp. NZLR1]|uniref:ABC transporter substrate-binding protein n=1 Tax=Rhizobium sp. NZLR1 TaxID=2731096 RepID=UPI001A98B0ED|nr:ABC transporter substrate-binding protein [Rhizobium sp. NZLR1]MBX5204042.1 ABC transporter substrate-binding protein [Rhizobium sp. NZLR1]QSZ25159.1 ABC transporter substrate-binding protein [Rhizobium sp. NZLR1]